jgi:hypothetical protein
MVQRAAEQNVVNAMPKCHRVNLKEGGIASHLNPILSSLSLSLCRKILYNTILMDDDFQMNWEERMNFV